MKRIAIAVKDVRKNYQLKGSEVQALRGVDLSIEAGEFLIILGPSGCGKTTLLSLLGALDQPSQGDVTVHGIPISSLKSDELARYRRTNIGMVFQQFNLLPNVAADENVAMPLILSGVPRREAIKRARELLKNVGLGDRAKHKPLELSGGEQQRVAIARALAANPWILFVDEPTGNLDEEAGLEIMELLKKVHSWGRTVVLVTHNADYISYATRVVNMRNGRITGEKIIRSSENTTTETETKGIKYYIAAFHQRVGMHSLEGLRFALRNFFSKKLRTLLTTLGVALGVGSIVTLVSVGIGLQEITTQQLAGFNALVTINVGLSKDAIGVLDDSVVNKLNQLPGVQRVSPSITIPGNGLIGQTSTQLFITGIEPDAQEFEGVTTNPGFTRLTTNQVILSKATAKNFVGDQTTSLIGQDIELLWTDLTQAKEEVTLENLGGFVSLDQLSHAATIVGVTNDEVTSTVYLPLADLRQQLTDTPYTSIKVQADDRAHVAEIRDQIEQLGFTTSSVVDLIEKIDNVFTITKIVLGVIGSVSLIVALLGIINIMTISLLERTHEVGILKAIGASDKNIKRIFQYEVLLFGLMGGLSGITTAWLFGLGVNALVAYMVQLTQSGTAPKIFVTPIFFAIEMLVVTVVIALIGGLYPARLAARLSPAEALRYQ